MKTARIPVHVRRIGKVTEARAHGITATGDNQAEALERYAEEATRILATDADPAVIRSANGEHTYTIAFNGSCWVALLYHSDSNARASWSTQGATRADAIRSAYAHLADLNGPEKDGPAAIMLYGSISDADRAHGEEHARRNHAARQQILAEQRAHIKDESGPFAPPSDEMQRDIFAAAASLA